jgi:hypothetical protein
VSLERTWPSGYFELSCCHACLLFTYDRDRKRKLEVEIVEETSVLEQLTITFEQSQLRGTSAVSEAQVPPL